MTSTKWYTAIYVVLFVFATAQVVVERVGILESGYWIGFGVILVLSFIKAVFVASEFQHLRFEPRSVTYIVITGLITALALTIAASYSIL